MVLQLSRRPRISIHTPTKGVTKSGEAKTYTIAISIHTPTKGVTADLSTDTDINQISIHTPTKGVTSTNRHNNAYDGYFNPHSHEGSDFCIFPILFF